MGIPVAEVETNVSPELLSDGELDEPYSPAIGIAEPYRAWKAATFSTITARPPAPRLEGGRVRLTTSVKHWQRNRQ